MCYFMYVVVERKIDSKTVSDYHHKNNIYIEDITSYVGNKREGLFYYSVNRQCACDFYSSNDNNNNVKEIKELFSSIRESAPFIFCIINDSHNKYDGISIQVLMDSFSKEELIFDDFINLYPIQLKYDHVYGIT